MFQIPKIILFFDLLILIYTNYPSNNTLNCESESLLSNDLKKNYKLKEIKELGPVNRAAGAVREEILHFIGSMYDFETDVDDYLYDLIESIDQECFDFILQGFFNETDFFRNISKTLFHDGGIIQNSIGTEEYCLNEDAVYIMLSGEYNRSELIEESSYKSDELLFREMNFVRQEICLFKPCRHFYKPLLEYLFKYHNDVLKQLLPMSNFKIAGINFKNISDDEKVQKTEEELEKEEKDKYYFYVTKICVIILAIFFIICSFISTCMERSEKRFLSKYAESKEIEDLIGGYDSMVEDEQIKEKQDIPLAKSLTMMNEKRCTDLRIYKIISSFDFIKNLAYLNRENEPLANQKNIIELSAIKFFTLFFIVLGENSYIILKYVENKMSVLSFCKHIFFFLIKLGMNSYETYKVICGILFGYKFISYYFKNKEKPLWKIIGIFATKPIPYLIMFFILHLLFNYPIFIYVRTLFGDIRNSYLSSKMEQFTCQKNAFKILNLCQIIGEYNTTEFNIGQFNGCSRPMLFTFSEFICFYLVLILALVNMYLCSKKIKGKNITYIILFVLNFIFLCLTYFVTKEVKDLTGEYTLSRLFGLSGSIAMPHLFFPLYYIGFNIGIIFYYKVKTNEMANEDKNNIPFKYCFDTSLFISGKGKLEKIIMFIFLIFIFFLSFSYTFLLNSLEEDKFLFTFNKIPISKFIFVYKGILQGISFSIIILIYLCLDDFLPKRVLSSKFFGFTHKISFIHFISFISILYFFHSIGTMQIYLLHFSVFSNTVILFIISCLFSIFITCIVFFPIKKIYLYITNGIDEIDAKEVVKDLKDSNE